MGTEGVSSDKTQTVDQYIDQFPVDVQAVLRTLRTTILMAVPQCVESIAYGMPAYKLNKKPLLYFGAFTHHVGLYATPTGHAAFAAKLAGYKQGRGSVQFPFSQPIPCDLIAEIAQFRAQHILCQK